MTLYFNYKCLLQTLLKGAQIGTFMEDDLASPSKSKIYMPRVAMSWVVLSIQADIRKASVQLS